MVNNKFLLIIGLASSLTVQAGSAESFCTDVIKKHNSNDMGVSCKYSEFSVEGQWDKCLRYRHRLQSDYEKWLGIYDSYTPSLKQQFQNCIDKKRQEQSDSGFLKYLDKY